MKSCSASSKNLFLFKDLFTRSNFKDPILGPENWAQMFGRSDFKLPSLSVPLIFQEDYWMKIEHVSFSSVSFSKLRMPVSEGQFYCFDTILFSEQAKIK